MLVIVVALAVIVPALFIVLMLFSAALQFVDDDEKNSGSEGED